MSTGTGLKPTDGTLFLGTCSEEKIKYNALPVVHFEATKITVEYEGHPWIFLSKNIFLLVVPIVVAKYPRYTHDRPFLSGILYSERQVAVPYP